MKQYLVESEYNCNIEELKSMLIAEIKEETLSNNEDVNIVKCNIDLLEKVYKNSYNDNFIIEQLESFGYIVIKVKDITNNLQCLNDYIKNSITIKNAINIDKIIKAIEVIQKYMEVK